MAEKKKKRSAFEQYKYEQKRKARLEEIKAAKAQKQKSIIIKSVIASISVITALSVIIFVVNSSGTDMRLKKAVYSDNVTVNNAMMSYYFYRYVDEFIENNHGVEIDTEKSLKKQYYDVDYSWYDYFSGAVQKTVSEKVAVVSEVKNQGKELSETQKRVIDEYITDLKEKAEKDGMSFKKYLENIAGKGFNEKDLRACLELDMLYYDYYSDFVENNQFTQEQLEAAYNQSPNNYISADFITYTFINGEANEQTDDEKTQTNNLLKEKAEELSKITSADNFEEYVRNYLKEQGKSDEEIASEIKECYVTGFNYELNSSVGEWIFSKKPKVGESTIIEGQNLYTVCLLTKEPYRSTTNTCNVRHILITEKRWGENTAVKTNEIMTRIIEANASSELFAHYASVYSEDSGSRNNGGLYLNVPQGKMVSEFDSWCFEKGRKAGDIGIVKTVYGYHIMYFEGDGLEEWQSDCYDTLIEDEYDSLLTQLKETYSLKNAGNYNFPSKR